MQETYAEAFLDIGGFVPQGAGSFGAWLSRMAKRNLTDTIRELRAKKRGGGWRRVQPLPSSDSALDLWEKLGATTTTGSKYLNAKELREAVVAAVAQLREIYRQVVVMYDLEHHSADEVARAIGRSEGAVFMIRERAHKQLRRILEKGSSFF